MSIEKKTVKEMGETVCEIRVVVSGKTGSAELEKEVLINCI